jgi:hypothetical protein
LIVPSTKIFPPCLVLVQDFCEKSALENTFKQSKPPMLGTIVSMAYYFILKIARKKKGG